MSHYKRGRPKSAARACSCGTKGCKRDGNTHTPLDERREPALDVVRPARGKKNTKRWCGGHVGREHQPAWVPNQQHRSYHWHDYVCKVCEKKLDYCWPWPWHNPKFVCKCGHHDALGWKKVVQ